MQICTISGSIRDISGPDEFAAFRVSKPVLGKRIGGLNYPTIEIKGEKVKWKEIKIVKKNGQSLRKIIP
jgi:hypothetical protein